MSRPASHANPEVLEFYRALPFNIRDSVEASVAALRADDHLAAYPVLAPLVRRGIRVLDVGCGTGWLANGLAHHHGAVVTGIDFNPVAIERARAVAAAMGLATRFEVADLFAWTPPEPFDLVISLGVLHHTDDCAAALEHVFSAFVRPGGHAFIGLYHRHGRKPLLDHFAAMKARGASEAQMLARYRELHSRLADETLLASWFRDQVLHPHETQHTLEEVLPILARAGMSLESTSINGFGPVEPRAALLAEERRAGDVAAERLARNEYHTGFFVFLARKDAAAPDSKPYIRHDPLIGFRYVPGARMELVRPGGGRYRIAINSQGIRADREYALAKPPGVTRIVACGDSMAAGQFVSNDLRFGELLERRVPGLEVLNLALEGSGTDQQLLLYEQVGLEYEHDAVLLLPFLQNIRRNLAEAREGFAPGTGARVLRGKPRFDLVDGRLELRNVPVPVELPAPGDAGEITDADRSTLADWKARASAAPGIDALKRVAYAIFPWEPFPEYRHRDHPAWQLMAAIIRRMKALAGPRPLVVAPTFYSSYVRFRMARNYWKRYAELATEPGVHVIDLLPHFRRDGVGQGAFLDPHDMHYSPYGHVVLADALETELARLGLVPSRAPTR